MTKTAFGLTRILVPALAVAAMVFVVAACARGGTPGRPATATPTPAEPISVPQLTIATPADDLPAYDRSDWRVWDDADGDCQNTRAEVLIVESMKPVTFTDANDCTVAGGEWLALYTNTTVTVASDLDIDHMVPLSNAHRSGGWEWTPEMKEAFANDLAYPDHLIAVTASANRSKGDRGPEEWRPPDEGYWCAYAEDWITIKAAWALTATSAEWAALLDMLDRCLGTVTIVPAPTPTPTPSPTSTPTPTATPTPAATPSEVGDIPAGTLVITEILIDPNAVSDTNGEWFEVFNASAGTSVDIDGWTIRDLDTDRHVIDSGGPLVIPPGGYVVLGRNADTASNGGVSVAYQYGGVTLANSGDELELVAVGGTVIDTVVYTSSVVFTGSSTSLSPGELTAAANDDAANWCAATTTLAGGDRGTPGAANDACL